jgi:REP element-mobilizing transposase RayT
MFRLSEILRGIKGASAKSVNQLLGGSGPLWQEESFDHVLRSEESLQQKIEYIRQNPVRRGLVKTPEDYRWLWIRG